MAQAAQEMKEEPEEFRYPLGITSDEEGDDIVRVCVVVPGLKSSGLFSDDTTSGNAQVDVKTDKQSLQVTIRMNKNNEKYRYTAKKLPNAIMPEKTKYKVKKDQVVIRLHKEKSSSWAQELADSGLDVASSSNEEESDEEEKMDDSNNAI